MAEELEKLLNDEAAMKKLCKEAFDEVDKDKSGEIDESELETAMIGISKEIKIDPPTKEEVTNLLKSLDRDKSGKLNLKEFSRFIIGFMAACLEEAKKNK